MIISIYISSNQTEEDFCNGLNVEISRVSNDQHVSISIQDDGGKGIIPTFDIDYEELKKAILKLDDKNEN